MNWNLQEAKTLVTAAHPFGVYIAGKHTTMGVASAVYALCDTDKNFQIYDGEGWLLPLIVTCSTEDDRDALADLFLQYDVPVTKF